MTWSFDQRIQRATELPAKNPASADLLGFYRELAIFQKPIFEALQFAGATGVDAVEPYCAPLVELVARRGPPGLADSGKDRINIELLRIAWEDGVAHTLAGDPVGRFFSRILLQPYAEYLASRADAQSKPDSQACSFCSSWPVGIVLRGEGDGAKRSLLCAVCSSEWPLRRILCWNCGEEDKEKLPIYKAAQFDAVRVDACDTCHVYLKSVDLTRDGRAVPMVDEIATVALDIWAEENGYAKMEVNLLGM